MFELVSRNSGACGRDIRAGAEPHDLRRTNGHSEAEGCCEAKAAFTPRHRLTSASSPLLVLVREPDQLGVERPHP